MRVRLGIVPDEESEEEVERGCDLLLRRDSSATSRSPASRPTCSSGSRPRECSPLRIAVDGLAAHGATPWLGENAILKAIEVFHVIESLPFAGESSELYDRPSINLGRILGGDALNKVPDACVIDVDVRYLPEQDPDAILDQVRGVEGAEVISTFRRPPAARRSSLAVRQRSLRRGIAASSRRGHVASAATAPPTRSRSCAPGSRRSSSARSARAITAPRSGSRSHRWRAIGERSPTSSRPFPHG